MHSKEVLTLRLLLLVRLKVLIYDRDSQEDPCTADSTVRHNPWRPRCCFEDARMYETGLAKRLKTGHGQTSCLSSEIRNTLSAATVGLTCP